MRNFMLYFIALMLTFALSTTSVMAYEALPNEPWFELIIPYEEGQNGDVVFYVGTIHGEQLIEDDYITGTYVSLVRDSAIYTYEYLMREKEGINNHTEWIFNPLTEAEYMAKGINPPSMSNYDFSYIEKMIPEKYTFADTVYVDHIEIIVQDIYFFDNNPIHVTLDNVHINTLEAFVPTGFGLFKSQNFDSSYFNPSINDYIIYYYGIKTGETGLVIGVYEDGKIVDSNEIAGVGFYPDFQSIEDYKAIFVYTNPLPIVIFIGIVVSFIVILLLYFGVHDQVKLVLSTDKSALLVIVAILLYYGLYALFIWIEFSYNVLYFTPLILYALITLLFLTVKSSVKSKEPVFKELGDLNNSSSSKISDEYKDFFESYSEKK